MSGTFGLEGWFISDFGDSFQYKNDPPNNKDVVSMSFPALESVLRRPWSAMKSRFHAVSSTFVKSRILRAFIDKHGRYPAATDDNADASALEKMASSLLDENGVQAADLSSPLDAEALPRIAAAVNVMTCSVLGSYLAQEVIKAVSLSGAPGDNVFVFDGNDCSVKVTPIGR
jgi:hypothetical protein